LDKRTRDDISLRVAAYEQQNYGNEIKLVGLRYIGYKKY